MAKKEEFIVKSTEEVQLNFYAVRNKEGKWFRAKGFGGGGDSWVDNLSKARIYANPGPAKTQITFWAKQYPQYGTPNLVRITTGVLEVIDQEERVKGNGKKIFKGGSYKYNGVDRFNNNKGYELDNCVPCCWKCNNAKNNMNISEFKEWIYRIYTYYYQSPSIKAPLSN